MTAGKETFWRLARCWLERGWWDEERAIPAYVGGAAKGRAR